MGHGGTWGWVYFRKYIIYNKIWLYTSSIIVIHQNILWKNYEGEKRWGCQLILHRYSWVLLWLGSKDGRIS